MSDELRERVISKYFAHVYVKDALPPGVRVDFKKQRAIGVGSASALRAPARVRKPSKPRVASPLALPSNSHKAPSVLIE